MPAAHGGLNSGAAGCPKETVTLWEADTRAASWQDYGPVEGSPQSSMFSATASQGIHDRSVHS